MVVENKRKFFNRNKKLVNRFTRNFLAKGKIGIVHGTRATNAQLPSAVRRKTLDWDVFVKKPKLRAKQLEKILDKRFGGDFFRVRKGLGSPGIKVFKIIDNQNNGGFVDFATANRKVPSVAIRGVRFATLKDQEERARINIKNPKLKFRREKDLNLIRRINKSKKFIGGRL